MPAPRVRFCPSPTGWLHVGGARTALYNWLYARQGGGAFVFRIEDTDAERATAASTAGMIEAMRFLGLDWDEGPEVGGAHGPYHQSERIPLYAAVADRLLKAGHAYDAYETPDELAAMREAAQRQGQPPGYFGNHRDLSDGDREAFLADGRRPVIRLRTPDEGSVTFVDAVRGEVTFDWAVISDPVIQRADGTAPYVLANAVDDIAMGINFIARGEDLLSATPTQIFVHELLDRDGLIDAALADAHFPARPADATLPVFAHLPLLVGEDRKPLSKRHGSVAVDEFRRQGLLPEVLVNFLALCGWSYDGVREVFTPEELVELFSFDRVSRNPAYFDTDKLRAMNGDRIKALGDAELAERLQPYLREAGLVAEPLEPDIQQRIVDLAPLLRERIQTLGEAVPLVAFCFTDTIAYDEASVAKHIGKEPAGEVLDRAAAALEALDDWSGESIEAALDAIAEALGIGRGKAYQPVRVAVAGTHVSPPLPQTLAVLDRDTVLARIRDARARYAV